MLEVASSTLAQDPGRAAEGNGMAETMLGVRVVHRVEFKPSSKGEDEGRPYL